MIKSSKRWQQLFKSPIPHILTFFCIEKKIKTEKLGNYILDIQTGKTPPKTNQEYFSSDDIAWYKPEDIGKKLYLGETSNFISKKAIEEKKSTIYKKGSLLINCIGDVGRASITTLDISSSNQQITGIYFNDKLLPEFVYYFLLSKYKELNLQASSTTLSIINQKKLRDIDIFIPTISEQKNIVDFLNYCIGCIDNKEFPVIDKFEFSSNISKFTKDLFLSYLSEKRLSKISDNTISLVSKLQQSILQDAIEGKLVPQDPNDEPASELLKKIQAEKEQLIKEKKIKKPKDLTPITDEEKSFELPHGWEWVRLGEISYQITDGTHYTPTYTESGIPFLSVKDVAHGKINFSNTRFISKEEHETLIKRCNPEYGDLLLTKVGTTGIAKIIDTKQEFSIFVSVALIKFFKNEIYGKYLQHLINSPYVKELSDKGTEGVGNKNLVLRKIVDFILPLPPLAEQKRIVAKVDELMSLCQKLGKEVDEAKHHGEKLMESVLGEVFR